MKNLLNTTKNNKLKTNKNNKYIKIGDEKL